MISRVLQGVSVFDRIVGGVGVFVEDEGGFWIRMKSVANVGRGVTSGIPRLALMAKIQGPEALRLAHGLPLSETSEGR